MGDFMSAFLPDLLSTVVGVGIGIPIGLWGNRRLVAEANTKRRQVEAAELSALVRTVLKALAHTSSELSRFANLRPGDRTGPRILDSGTWDALKGRLPREFGPPEVVQRLAFYWVQLIAFNRFHRDILESELRGELAGDPLDVSCNLRNSWARDLSAEGSQLGTELSVLHEGLAESA